jgi:nicotinamide mononucleotide (NMN) deamidase PncC
VWIAVADGTGVSARHVMFAGSRQEIRGRAAQMALFLLRRRLAGAV